MRGRNKNISFLNPELLLILLIYFTGLLFIGSEGNHPREKSGNPLSTEVSVNQDNAVPGPVIGQKLFQKSGNLIKADYKLLTFNKIPFDENKMVDLKIFQLQIIYQNLDSISLQVFRRYLFPCRNDEIPVLS
jgi:hypothetical protein